jgi:type II secretory pathway pseudopilin PulG
MSPAQRDLRIAAIALAVLILTVEAAAAQGQPQTPETLKSESTGPQDPRSTGSVGRSNEPLSEKLDRTDGVIRPPADIAPDMTLRSPVPNPGTTLVIPPPSTSGGDQSVEPK